MTYSRLAAGALQVRRWRTPLAAITPFGPENRLDFPNWNKTARPFCGGGNFSAAGAVQGCVKLWDVRPV